MNGFAKVAEGVAPWLCLDVETYHGSPEDAPRWVRENWWPAETWTPETIGKRFREKIDETREKMALKDEAQIATIQLGTDSETLLLHCFGAEPAKWFAEGVAVHGFATEAEMLLGFREFAERRTDDGTELVGWNIDGFDLRKLRLRSVINGLNPARVLRPRQPVCDMMDRYVRDWSVDRAPFVKLEVALKAFGLANHKAEVDGSMVGEMIAGKRFNEVLEYGLKDVNAERELYLRMTGRSGAWK